jgi:hypothetical protein
MDQKIETSGECIQRKTEDQCNHQRPGEFDLETAILKLIFLPFYLGPSWRKYYYFIETSLNLAFCWLSNNFIQLNTNTSVKWEMFHTFYFAGNRNGGARFCQRKEICGSRVRRSENLLARPGKS